MEIFIYDVCGARTKKHFQFSFAFMSFADHTGQGRLGVFRGGGGGMGRVGAFRIILYVRGHAILRNGSRGKITTIALTDRKSLFSYIGRGKTGPPNGIRPAMSTKEKCWRAGKSKKKERRARALSYIYVYMK